MKGSFKDELRVNNFKIKITEMFEVIIDHFPPFLLSKKKRVTDQPTDGRTDIPSYRDARTHLKTEG